MTENSEPAAAPEETLLNYGKVILADGLAALQLMLERRGLITEDSEDPLKEFRFYGGPLHFSKHAREIRLHADRLPGAWEDTEQLLLVNALELSLEELESEKVELVANEQIILTIGEELQCELTLSELATARANLNSQLQLSAVLLENFNALPFENFQEMLEPVDTEEQIRAKILALDLTLTELRHMMLALELIGHFEVTAAGGELRSSEEEVLAYESE